MAIETELDINDDEQLRYIASQAADARLNVELETEGMTLNIGPQHPATHGTLRIVMSENCNHRGKITGAQTTCILPVNHCTT